MSLSDSKRVLLVSFTGRHRCFVSTETANRRRSEGAGDYDGKVKVHGVKVDLKDESSDPKTDNNKKRVEVWNLSIPNAKGLCVQCKKGNTQCRDVTVRQFRFNSTAHGPATSKHLRVKRSRTGRTDPHAALIRRANPSLEQIRRDRREMLAKPDHVPFEHKYLGHVESADINPVCEEFDFLPAIIDNLNLELRALEKRVASFCRHTSDVPCEKCVAKGTEAANQLRETWSERLRRSIQDGRTAQPTQWKLAPQYKKIVKPVVAKLENPVVAEKLARQIAFEKYVEREKQRLDALDDEAFKREFDALLAN